MRGFLRGQMRARLLRLLGMIVVETLPVAYSSITDDYLQPHGDCNWFYFFTVEGVSGDSSMYILHFPAPCNRRSGGKQP